MHRGIVWRRRTTDKARSRFLSRCLRTDRQTDALDAGHHLGRYATGPSWPKVMTVFSRTCATLPRVGLHLQSRKKLYLVLFRIRGSILCGQSRNNGMRLAGMVWLDDAGDPTCSSLSPADDHRQSEKYNFRYNMVGSAGDKVWAQLGSMTWRG
ncbi:hypothetical protein LZ30DRAFT_705055 [Colletotrichum cereale]|nr:hypothetical protein LZ30DRAFT_705055 [Colletotrichum cereale]